MTAPVEPEAAQIQTFWDRYLAASGEDPSMPVPVAGPFGDSMALADELVGLVLEGRKRATAGALADYERSGEALPTVGYRWIATDGSGRPRVVLRTTEVRVGPLSSVDDAFAWDKGEGDRSRAGWLDEHERYFGRLLASFGVPFSSDLACVFERFEVAFAE
jgi:uncharacterized protein YhfF